MAKAQEEGQPTPLEQALLDLLLSNSGQFDEVAFSCVLTSVIQPSALAAHNAAPKPT
ncbi:MAG TPA: hypothetical protein VFV38_02270 [Ktedonobacteraceae bacterium]|nr:hypothetical protein [Ktedonobacteraceae bacterium]